MKKVYLYNTATRKKEEFIPIEGNKVGIYSCGPTVYWNQHVGNMYAFTVWDVLVRALEYLGYEVKWVMNITDVGHNTSDGDEGEDKMEKGAKREGLSVWEIAKKYETQFLNSMESLNILPPEVLCRATEHIPEQISLAKKIEERGFGYMTKTGLVFDTAKFKNYAKFANLKLEEMEAGSRVEIDEEKKHPWDFLLWVTNQPTHIMKWDSPWGEGFPGWHLECTAMSTKYLGEEFDIHTGGIEHIGVHHTNEIAQGYGAFGHQTARYWLHNAWLTLKEGKMSKSLGNVYTTQQLIEMGYDPLALRYLVLGSHYRKGLVFSLEGLKAAETALNRLRLLKVDGVGEVEENYRREFEEKLGDDLAMPEVMALVWRLAKDETIRPENKWATLLDFDRVLGLNLAYQGSREVEIPKDVEELAQKRLKAREEKNWGESDRLRNEIGSRGYMIEDVEGGYRLKKK
jgi:cysteinyl-tRNA synthetase